MSHPDNSTPTSPHTGNPAASVTLPDRPADYQVSLDVWGTFDPGEPMVRTTKDGDGYPGSPPSIDIEAVASDGYEVTSPDVREAIIEDILGQLADREAAE